MRYTYTAVITPEDGKYYVRVPDITGCITTGKGLEDAVVQITDALPYGLAGQRVSHPPSDPTAGYPPWCEGSSCECKRGDCCITHHACCNALCGPFAPLSGGYPFRPKRTCSAALYAAPELSPPAFEQGKNILVNPLIENL